MTGTGTLTHPGENAADSEVGTSDVSWESLSSEELKSVVSRGVQGGEWFYAASRELQRRAALATTTAEEAETSVTRRKQRMTQIAILAVAAFLLVASAIEIWSRF